MTISKSIILLTFLVAMTSTVRADNYGPILGKGIEVRTYNILGTLEQSGSQVFDAMPQRCMMTKPVFESRHTFSYYKNTQSFYRSVGTSAKLDAKLQSDYTMGFTLDMASGSVSGSSRMVSGDSLLIAASTTQEMLVSACLYQQPLYSGLINDLANLPARVYEPWKSASWQAYDFFLKKYGSHIVSGITYGSSINQMSFASEFDMYQERSFEINTCVALVGPTEAGMANVSACAGISQEEIDKSSQYSMTTSLSVNGGTSETRNLLITERNDYLINKFLNEANATHAPIFYQFAPIWEIIQGHSNSSNEDLVKSVNLEQYYTGYLTYGCDYQETAGQHMQVFNLSSLSSPASPRYACTLAPQGCHHSDDCHYRLVKCKCEGGSCVRYYDIEQKDGKLKQQAQINEADKWYWHGCDWKVRGSVCECKSPSNERYIVWSGDNKADVGLNHDSTRGAGKAKAADKKQEL